MSHEEEQREVRRALDAELQMANAEIERLREFLDLKEKAKQSLLRTVEAKNALIIELINALKKLSYCDTPDTRRLMQRAQYNIGCSEIT